MGNTLLTPDIIAQAALANLYENTVMAQLVHRDYEQEFAKKVGDTITIRKPAVFVANEFNRTTGIQIQDATEGSLTMALNHFRDVSFAITSEDRTLKLDDFNGRLLAPAMEALSLAIDGDLLALRNDVTQEVGTAAGELWNNPNALIGAGRVLTQNKVPFNNRYAVVGPATAAEWSKDDRLFRADARGDTVGLKEAAFGPRLLGFDPYLTNHITVPTQVTGNSTTEVGVAFHETAFALAVRPLALPAGANNAAIADYQGFGLRVIIDYDVNKKQDVCSIDVLYGVKTLDKNRACLIKGATHA